MPEIKQLIENYVLIVMREDANRDICTSNGDIEEEAEFEH